MPRTIAVGEHLPDMALPNQKGETVQLSDLWKQGPMVLYFYPKDETPGCTAEACTFRDQFTDFETAGARVVGVSSDSPESHARFAEKHRLPFTLLSDPGGKLRKELGVPKTLGLIDGRVTFVIDGKGFVRGVFNSQFRATKHVSEALEVLRNL
ncbi:MAG: peroxiredoxin [Polyangiaceae bacterium]